MLRHEGFSMNDPDILATTGWTTADLMQGIKKANVDKRYDVVSLLIGVNNQYQGRPLDEYEIDFHQLLMEAIKLADGKENRVFVLSIPDYSITPFASPLDTGEIQRSLQEFNAINRSISLKFAVHYVEITGESRKAAEDHSLLASDGLHYSGKEYARWAAILSSAIGNSIK